MLMTRCKAWLRNVVSSVLVALLPAMTAQAYTAEQDTVVACTQEICAEESIESGDTLCVDTLSETAHSSLPWPQSLRADIDSIVAKSTFLNTSQLGLMVYDLTDDTVLYTLGEKQTLRPASTMKLLTAVTALDKLGSAYLYKTRLCHTGTVVDSVKTLEGDIYIIGGMDPRLGRDDLRSFAMAVKELGVDTIRGNVYADRTMKDSDLLGEGWCWDDDNPVLSPLVYGRKDKMLERFGSVLADAGIYIDGELLEKACPSGAKELCVQTHTIEQILHRMMKDSDNLYAESMFYQIGLTKGRPSTARKAKAVMEALLRKMGLNKQPHRFADGSGLSLYNYVSAEMEVAFLRYAYNNTDIYSNLRPALPVAAVDGTLEKRMIRTAAAGNVHAKTGTLTGISSLAGYCTAANGHDLCFAIINQGVMKSAVAKAFQDKVCAAMCR